MPTDVLILGATALLAVVAVVAAVVTVRAARAVARAQARPAPEAQAPPVDTPPAGDVALPVPYERTSADAVVTAPGPIEPRQVRVVEGRVVVVPTQQQVVATALNRPATRLTVLAHGLAHALRPESRDRIRALMRRELTRRRRERSRVARRAAHAHVPAAPSTTAWVGTDTGDPPGGGPA